MKTDELILQQQFLEAALLQGRPYAEVNHVAHDGILGLLPIPQPSPQVSCLAKGRTTYTEGKKNMVVIILQI